MKNRREEEMQNVKTEIYGTFGPACKSKEILEEMIKAGMTGMRLNLSHTTLEKSKEYIENYTIVAEKQGVTPQILIDMQGPELRIGDMNESFLEEGTIVLLESVEQHNCQEQIEKIVELSKGRNVDCGTRIKISIPKAVLSELEIGNEVLLDDGKIRIRVEEIIPDGVYAKVLMGGSLKAHKSIKIVDVNVECRCLQNMTFIISVWPRNMG